LIVKTYSIGLAKVQIVLCYYGSANEYWYTSIYMSTERDDVSICDQGKTVGTRQNTSTKKLGEKVEQKGREEENRIKNGNEREKGRWGQSEVDRIDETQPHGAVSISVLFI
jgi:hypothetical protein